MTTAARPTFDPAKGGSGIREKSLGKLSQQLSSRDLPGHKTLKERIPGQDTIDEVNARDLRAELEERERIAQLEKGKGLRLVPSLQQAAERRLAIKQSAEKGDADEEATKSHASFEIINARKMAQLDADEDFSGPEINDSDLEDDDDDEDDEDNDDEEDDREELMAELERIRKERLDEEKKRQLEVKERVETTKSVYEDEPSFSIKRRWDDDVPFKNCARADPDPKRKLYVNDTLRQEFHKRFMDKYIRAATGISLFDIRNQLTYVDLLRVGEIGGIHKLRAKSLA